jgi:hypothetical protein
MISSRIKIHGLIVNRNESQRYLESCLIWNKALFDTLYLYDDQSTDNSVAIASRHCTAIDIRQDGPSFLEHEGKFREGAYKAWEKTIQPQQNDWVFVFDTDQFVVGNNGASVKPVLYCLTDKAIKSHKDSVRLAVPEVWAIDTHMYIRTDGFWNTNTNCHFFKYQSGGSFKDLAMGCGSTPTYVKNPLENISDCRILHFGYLSPEDRNEKYNRYTSLPNHGHNPKHIESILRPPTLMRYYGQEPIWYLGERP